MTLHRSFRIDAKRTNQKDAHDEAEEVKAHQRGDSEVQAQHAGDPRSACSLWPDENEKRTFEHDRRPRACEKKVWPLRRPAHVNVLVEGESEHSPEDFAGSPLDTLNFFIGAKEVGEAKLDLKNAKAEARGG